MSYLKSNTASRARKAQLTTETIARWANFRCNVQASRRVYRSMPGKTGRPSPPWTLRQAWTTPSLVGKQIKATTLPSRKTAWWWKKVSRHCIERWMRHLTPTCTLRRRTSTQRISIRSKKTGWAKARTPSTWLMWECDPALQLPLAITKSLSELKVQDGTRTPASSCPLIALCRRKNRILDLAASVTSEFLITEGRALAKLTTMSSNCLSIQPWRRLSRKRWAIRTWRSICRIMNSSETTSCLKVTQVREGRDLRCWRSARPRSLLTLTTRCPIWMLTKGSGLLLSSSIDRGHPRLTKEAKHLSATRNQIRMCSTTPSLSERIINELTY